MTLPELLIAVLLMGTLVAAMAVATTTILRQGDNSEGRLNNSRSEQSVSFWMPTDLASAEDVSQDADASPCGTQCPPNVNLGGSNALMLSWQSSTPGATEAVVTYTKVSYRYVQIGDEFVILRVECNSVGAAAPTCSQSVLLHDVDPPPAGQPWIPGETKPTWVMVVSLALDPADVTPDGEESGSTLPVDPTLKSKNGQRVTVTINGRGDIAGAGGGVDRITLSAGGTERKTDLSTSNLTDPPTFTSTRSRCGGNFGMIVDTSGSIGSSNMTSVNNGINGFIDSFAGTPIKLQIVRFQSTASTLGLAGGSESQYYDMLVDADVAALKSLVSDMESTGGTNWEDGFVRMFRKSTGAVQDILPDTLIFFTDGIPTRSRVNGTSMAGVAVTAHPDDVGFTTSVGSAFQQVGWNRANRVAREFEPDLERFVGVYVGNDTSGTSTWQTRGAGYHLESFQRGYRLTYERGYNLTNTQRGYHLNYTYQRAGSGLTYEKKTGSTWGSTSRSTYESSNSSPGDSDGWRARVSGSLGSWTSTSSTNYTKSNITGDSTDGFRINTTTVSYTSPYTSWESTSESSYLSGNTTNDDTDGWKATITYAAPFSLWESTTQSAYDTGNTTADSLDGWRTTNVYSSPYSLWETTTESAYNSGNSSWGDVDGWRATKSYTLPYTYFENTTSAPKANTDILGQLVTTGAWTPASPAGGPYTNADVADLYVLPDWDEFAGALNSLALNECGGTLTVQTKVGSASAADPFSYLNSKTSTYVTTSSLYKSGTFDFKTSIPISVTLTTQNQTGLERYTPVSWSCKSAGVAVPITTAAVDGSPWPSVTVTVSPNSAISCIQTVALS